MKKGIRYLLLTVLLCISFTKVKALSVSKNNLTMTPGSTEEIELYANSDSEINNINFSLVYTTYDITADYIPENGITDNPSGIKHSLKLSSNKSGKILLGTILIKVVDNPKDLNGTITVHAANAITTTDETIKLNTQTINVKVNENIAEPIPNEKKEIDKNLLTKIDSKIVEISLKKDIFDYEVEIDDNIKELDLKPITTNEDIEVTVSNQIIKELTDNKITITAKVDDTEVIYTINVKVKKREIKKIAIDNNVFVATDSYKGKWKKIVIVVVIGLVISLLLCKKEKKHKKRRKKKVD